LRKTIIVLSQAIDRKGETAIRVMVPMEVWQAAWMAGRTKGESLMIKHIVMFRLKELAEGKNREDNIAALKEMLEALPAKIDEIRFFEVGINFLQASVAYDIVLISEFESIEALHNYQKHSEHLKVFDFVSKTCDSRVVIDYAL
jgi:hypothetical protein